MNRRIRQDIDTLSLTRVARVGRVIGDAAFVAGMLALAWLALVGAP